MRFLHLLLVFGILLLPACAAPTVANDGPVLNLLASSNSVKVGETFILTLQVEGVSGLTAFETHLFFDPALLEVVSIQPGGFLLPDFLVQETFDNAAGTIDYAAAQMDRPPAQGSGALLQVTLRARASGTALIRFRETPAAPDGVILADADGYAIQAALGDVKINVSP